MGGGRDIPNSRMSTDKCGWNGRMENHSSATIAVKSGLGKIHQCMLNVEKMCKEVEYLHGLKNVSLLNPYWLQGEQ